MRTTDPERLRHAGGHGRQEEVPDHAGRTGETRAQVAYRYEDVHYAGLEDDRGRHSSYLVIECREYEILRHTPKGFWINLGYATRLTIRTSDGARSRGTLFSPDIEKKFVLNTATKRFACLTRAEAKESFIRRKQRQKSILQHRLDDVNNALLQAQDL